MARATFVVNRGPFAGLETAARQDEVPLSESMKRFGIDTWSEDANITQDLDEAVRLLVVVGAPDPANVRAFINERYGDLITDEVKSELDRQLG